jgi:hypothetical protein
VAVVATAAMGLARFAPVARLWAGAEWPPVQIHRIGLRLRAACPRGPVLTLSPIMPLEGGLPIYAEFATGPFAPRAAVFLTPSERKVFKMTAMEDVPQLLRERPAAGILTGLERSLDNPLNAAARANDMQASRLEDSGGVFGRHVLWLWVNGNAQGLPSVNSGNDHTAKEGEWP